MNTFAPQSFSAELFYAINFKKGHRSYFNLKCGLMRLVELFDRRNILKNNAA